MITVQKLIALYCISVKRRLEDYILTACDDGNTSTATNIFYKMSPKMCVKKY